MLNLNYQYKKLNTFQILSKCITRFCQIIETVFFNVYAILIAIGFNIFIAYYLGLEDDLIPSAYFEFKNFSLDFDLCELPIILLSIIYIYTKAYYDGEKGLSFCILRMIHITPFMLGLAFLTTNNLFLSINYIFDYSSPTTRYVQVMEKRIDKGMHCILVSSWDPKEKRNLCFSINSDIWEKTNIGDVIIYKSKKGLLNYEYLTNRNNFKKINKEKFPPDTVFPLTKEEAQKAMLHEADKTEEN